ncbi:DUF3427 domain-containing protein [Burkholderia sp. Bp9090]|uniref:DUF3427 domain-containing protein n=1 Tax=Burkholderia sp. Bp9090 TaxID=2184567 RepID=UPI000F5ED56D|nr:DUF3427 domain-containing protein [Burkholderia sp. Bp9090]RQZ39661.1 DUF3427 domain-containing protein [Burkholderia sp. Bp9090]
MLTDIYQFIIGHLYSRRDVFKIIGIDDPKGGAWYTGYTSHQRDWFIFCGIGTSGRTGHSYPNHFIGNDLVWFGKTRTTTQQPAIKSLTSNNSRVYIFYRNNNRDLFTFAGIAKAKTIKDSIPVEVLWTFENTLAVDFTYPEEIIDSESVTEGTKKSITINVYERDSGAREKCIKRWGLKCSVCDFDFRIQYGELGENYIHVHHLRPISEIGTTYQLDPLNDLRPVCPNCHAMLHRQKPPLSIESLRELVRRQRGIVADACISTEISIHSNSSAHNKSGKRGKR